MPKSSIASRTPSAFRFSSTSVAASGSASTALSVISRHSSFGSRPLSVERVSTTVATKSPSASWRGETLTETVSGRSTRAHPLGRLAAGLLDDPRADRDDQAGLLGDRDERPAGRPCRAPGAPSGSAPRRRRSCRRSCRPAAGRRSFSSPRSSALRRPPSRSRRSMAFSRIESSKISQRALPSSFARYMAASASRSSASGSATPTGSAAHAEARGHEALAAVELDRRAQGAGQAVGDAAGGDSRRRAGDHHRELVAAEAGDHVAGAQHAAQALGDDLEQAVAGPVAERVVDDLEVVEVDEQDRDLERLRVGDRLAAGAAGRTCGSAARSAGRGAPGSRAGARRPCAWRCRGSGRPSTRARRRGRGRASAATGPSRCRRWRTGSGARSRRRRPAARRRRGPPRARARRARSRRARPRERPVRRAQAVVDALDRRRRGRRWPCRSARPRTRSGSARRSRARTRGRPRSCARRRC